MIVVSGAVASTVHVRATGQVGVAGRVGARALKVRAVADAASVTGEAQGANAPPSTEHSKLEPASLEESSKAGVGSFVVPPRQDRR